MYKKLTLKLPIISQTINPINMKKSVVLAVALLMAGGTSVFAQYSATTNNEIASETSTAVQSAAPYSLHTTIALPKHHRAEAWGQGKSVITVGYGFPNLTKTVFKIYQSELDFKLSGFGPMHLKYEYGVSDKIGLGVSIGYVSTKVEWKYDGYDSLGMPATYTEGYKGSSLGILVRMNVHFATGDKIDPYWGVGMGYNNYSFKYYTDEPGAEDLTLKFPIPFGFETTFGCRFYFSDNIGAYAEVGYGKSLAQVGLSAKF